MSRLFSYTPCSYFKMRTKGGAILQEHYALLETFSANAPQGV